MDLPDFQTRLVFAITSIAVGFKEEITYRGILQNLLARKYGVLIGLVVASVLFMLMHVGYQKLTYENFTKLFLVGIVLGSLYYFTKSLCFCIIIHSLVDAIYSFSPFFSFTISSLWGPCIIVFVISLWGLRTAINDKAKV
ncbi:MAG: CPBP family intramembrane glutamic endopeptidase [Fibrobacterota bacterium]